MYSYGLFERAEQGFALTHMNAWLQVRHLESMRARSEMVERGIIAQAQLLQKTGAPPGSGGRRYPHYTMRHRTTRHGQTSFPKTFGARARALAFCTPTPTHSLFTCCSCLPVSPRVIVIFSEPDDDADADADASGQSIVRCMTGRAIERLVSFVLCNRHEAGGLRGADGPAAADDRG